MPHTINEWREFLLRTFSDSMSYDVKESAVRLSDRIEWGLLENDSVAIGILQKFSQDANLFGLDDLYMDKVDYKKRDIMLERLQRMLEILFQVAELNALYSITPDSIRNVVERLVEQSNISNMLDLCCGSGGLGIAVWRQLKEDVKVIYHGMDIEPVMCDICTIMTYICGIPQSMVVWQDILRSNGENNTEKYDLVLLDVPRGQNKYTQAQGYSNWLEGIEQKNIFVDWLYVMRAIHYLNDRGKGIVIVTSGTLTRKNEMELRKKMILSDWVEAVITLPVNLYPNTRTGSEIIIFNKAKDKKRRKKILFIDISKFYFRDNRNFYSITKEGIDIVTDIFNNYYEMYNVSRIMDISQVEEENWSLKPLRYMEVHNNKNKNCDLLCLKDIANIVRGVQLKKEEEDILCKNGSAFYLNIKDIRDGRIHYEGAKMIWPKNKDWHEKFEIKEDDILITSKGTSLKIAIVDENPPEAYICGNLTLLRVNAEKYHPYILFEFLTSEEGKRALESIQSGTTIRVLNNSNLEGLQVPIYNKDVMIKVGKKLKEKRKRYETELRQIVDNYIMERNVLLELVGIKKQ